MADKKITALTALTADGKVSATDLLHIIDYSASPVNKKITVAHLFEKVNAVISSYGAFSHDLGYTASLSGLKCAIGTSANDANKSEIIVNDNGSQFIDFRAETSLNDHAFHIDSSVDGGAGNVNTITINGGAIAGTKKVDFKVNSSTGILVHCDSTDHAVGIGTATPHTTFLLDVAAVGGKSIKTAGSVEITGSITASANATVTGNVSMGGLVHLTQAEGSVVAASANGEGAAAIPVNTTVTYVSNTTGGNLYCDLANGTTEGQIKIIICTAVGGSAPVVKITPASIDTVTSFDLNAVGEAVTLLWHNSKWICIGAHMNAVTA